MKKTCHFIHGLLLATAASLAQGEPMQLTTDIPDCRMPAGKVLPQKYQTLAKKYKEFAWIRKAGADDYIVNGEGWERIDGSSMFNWFTFFRVDLNNDGLCDWYLNASAPMSTGGDRDSINTIYIGRAKGWSRLGARVPDNKPDQLGAGSAIAEQDNYLFGEEIATIHDASSGTNYIVSAFFNRHVQRDSMPGYRVMAWDTDKKTLRLLDKWEPGSKTAEVYAFFKQHGARTPAPKTAAPEDTLYRFDPEIDAFEIEQACNPDSLQRSAPDLYGAVSPHLPARCERQQAR